jgi:hypothetical protein
MWELESAAPPADAEARQIQVTLARSRPRYVSPDLEFAVWTATIGESREGEPVTVTGPLGHVTAGEQLVCTGAFSQHPRYGWQFSVETFRSALPRSPEGIALWLMTRVPGIGPTFAGAIVATTSGPSRSSPSSTAGRSGCVRCAPRPVARSRGEASSAQLRRLSRREGVLDPALVEGDVGKEAQRDPLGERVMLEPCLTEVLFAELAGALEVAALAVHPGVIFSRLQRGMPRGVH